MPELLVELLGTLGALPLHRVPELPKLAHKSAVAHATHERPSPIPLPSALVLAGNAERRVRPASPCQCLQVRFS